MQTETWEICSSEGTDFVERFRRMMELLVLHKPFIIHILIFTSRNIKVNLRNQLSFYICIQ